MYLSKENLNKSRDALLVSLKTQGITHVTAEYEGGGDSGGVETVTALPDNVDLDSVQVTMPVTGQVHRDGEWVEETRDETMSLTNAVHQFVYDVLRAYYPGWEINDGGRGTVTIDAEAGAAKLDHTMFYTESNDYEHDL
jgi:hypothetical protein